MRAQRRLQSLRPPTPQCKYTAPPVLLNKGITCYFYIYIYIYIYIIHIIYIYIYILTYVYIYIYIYIYILALRNASSLPEARLFGSPVSSHIYIYIYRERERYSYTIYIYIYSLVMCVYIYTHIHITFYISLVSLVACIDLLVESHELLIEPHSSDLIWRDCSLSCHLRLVEGMIGVNKIHAGSESIQQLC